MSSIRQLLQNLKQVCQSVSGKLRQAYRWIVTRPKWLYRVALLGTVIMSILKITITLAAIAQEGPLPHPGVITAYTIIFAVLTLLLLGIVMKMIPDDCDSELYRLRWVVHGVSACFAAVIFSYVLIIFFKMNSDVALMIPVVPVSIFMCILPLVFLLQDIGPDCYDYFHRVQSVSSVPPKQNSPTKDDVGSTTDDEVGEGTHLLVRRDQGMKVDTA
jgi:hypothetical protein